MHQRRREKILQHIQPFKESLCSLLFLSFDWHVLCKASDIDQKKRTRKQQDKKVVDKIKYHLVDGLLEINCQTSTNQKT